MPNFALNLTPNFTPKPNVLYVLALAASLTVPAACSKKAPPHTLVTPTVFATTAEAPSDPQAASTVDSTANAESLAAAERLRSSTINSDGQRVDATGQYYLDEQGNIIGTVEPSQPTANVGPAAVVYFDYDSSLLSEDAQQTLNQQAAGLTTNPDLVVVVQGHTDQRGTREYNLALGERRAKQVQDYLQFTGVKTEQISTISYGKEKLATTDNNEEGLKLNRRAELHYPNP